MLLRCLLVSLWRNLFRKDQIEQELNEELSAHLEMLIEVKIKESLDPAEARRTALIELGGVEQVKESIREVKMGYDIGNLYQDLEYGMRMLLKKPGFTLIAIFTLALGIGANSAIFSVVNAVLLRSLPFEQPDRIVYIWNKSTEESNNQVTASFPDFNEWKANSGQFDFMSAYSFRAYNLTGSKEPEPVQGALVTTEFLQVIGVNPIIGRDFSINDEHSNVVILGYNLWQRRFNSDTSIIGKSIIMSNASYTIIGVMPKGFNFPRKDVEAWVTFGNLYTTESFKQRGYRFLRVIASLKTNVTLDQAKSEMVAKAGRLEQQYPDTNKGFSVNLTPVREEMLGDISIRIYLVWAAAGIVLLIACANLANMLMARASIREREISIRLALGATRARIIRQLLTESFLMSFIGGLIGLVLAIVVVRYLVYINPDNIPRFDTVGVDFRSIIFTFMISLLTGLIFGLLPAVQTSRKDVNTDIKEGGRGVIASSSKFFLQNMVVIAEISFAIMLLVSAGLILRSFVNLSNISVGFDPNKVISMYIAYSNDKYPERYQRENYMQRILGKIESLPEVKAVSIGLSRPPDELYRRDSFSIEDRTDQNIKNKYVADYLPISSHYFRVLNIPIIKGREFTDADKEGAQKVTIINETLAQRFFKNEDPIGKHINLGDAGDPSTSFEIVGVVNDIKYSGLTDKPQNQLYFSYLQQQFGGVFIFVRTVSDPAKMRELIKRQIYSIDFDQPVREMLTIEELLDNALIQQRFNMILLGVFASLALILTMVGVYGVISYSVAQRNHEICIRIALGATQSSVMKMIFRHGFILLLLGLLIGIMSALAATQIIKSLLYNVNAVDVTTYFVTILVISVVALLASLIPALRAIRVNPVNAFR